MPLNVMPHQFPLISPVDAILKGGGERERQKGRASEGVRERDDHKVLVVAEEDSSFGSQKLHTTVASGLMQ